MTMTNAAPAPPAFLLLRGGELYAPEKLGRRDLLIGGERILAIAEHLEAPNLPGCQEVDARGLTLCPGLIDQHLHLIGGGGEAGPHSRTPEVRLSSLLEGGITTVVGLLGTDAITRHPESLLAKARALNSEGITAFMLTGAYGVPTPTITGSIQRDIAFIDPIIGVKTAISDHRSSAPGIGELARIAAEARLGGLLGGKAGISVFHLGNGRRALEPLYGILEHSDVPIGQLLPTHVNRTAALYEAAIRFALDGGNIDLTSGINPELGARQALKSSRAVIQALSAGVALQRLTISSDANGSQPVFDSDGRLTGLALAGCKSLMNELRDLVLREQLPLEQALRPFTSNVADLLRLQGRKGRLAVGLEADVLLLDERLELVQAFARGRQVVLGGRACLWGTFEGE